MLIIEYIMIDQIDLETKSRPSKEIPNVSPEDLDRICSLKVGDSEKIYMDILALDQPERVRDYARVLMTRDFYNELPVEQETFVLRRNEEECKKLRSSAIKLAKPDSDLTSR